MFAPICSRSAKMQLFRAKPFPMPSALRREILPSYHVLLGHPLPPLPLAVFWDGHALNFYLLKI